MKKEIIPTIIDHEIIKLAIKYQQTHFPQRTDDYDKCYRDIELILSAYQRDIENNTSSAITQMASKFWKNNNRLIKSFDVELEIHDYIVTLLTEKFSEDINLINQLQLLKEKLFQVIKFGPENSKFFHGIMSSRENTYTWEEKVPSDETIKAIINDLHNYSPSKQRRVRYNLAVIKNNDTEVRDKIYISTKADPSNKNSRYNPQVLAPWILAFGVNHERNFEKRDKNSFENEAYLDIGIASAYIALIARDYDLDIGFCACVQNRSSLIPFIGLSPVLCLGLGYNAKKRKYFSPVYKQEVFIPNSNFDTKPKLEEYVNYINGRIK